MINFCPILPTSMNDYALEFKYTLILAQMYIKDPVYREFYKTHRDNFDCLILDNGAAEEGSVSDRALVDIALELRPHVLIVPDYMHDYEATWNRTVTFVKMFAKELEGIELAGVAHGKDFLEWSKCYLGMCSVNELSWICVPKEAPPNRTHILASNALYNCPKKVHLLGLWNPIELLFAQRYDCIKSIDSKIPISYGYNLQNLPLDFGDRGKFPSIPDEDFYKISAPKEKEWEYIKENIQFMHRLCTDAYATSLNHIGGVK